MSNTGFTASGQPRQGSRYTLTQGDVVIPVTVVGKAYGRGGNADLVGVLLEDRDSGGREMFDWPIEAEDGAEPISFTAGWPK
ncbi:MAG TPA: hypothetical protein VIG24_04960 [Acidimicrobiia bacterium]